MIKILVIFIFFTSIIQAQEIPLPINCVRVDTATGDLDKDGIIELVVVYNSDREDTNSLGLERELHIFKLKDRQWSLWKKSTQALLGSEGGGMMGDPFGEVKIENGILSILHQGGSSWKWDYTDKYRFQNNDFKLIGHTSTYGKICEYWTTFDCNLVTGKIIYSSQADTCEEEPGEPHSNESETFYKKGITVSLFNRFSKEIIIKTPKYGRDIYF